MISLRTLFASFVGAALVCAAHANLVTNGSFETGDFSGWLLSGNVGFTGVQGNFAGVNPEDGNFQAYFGAIGSTGSLDQDISTTAGDSYDVSFWLFNFGGTPNSFSASFGATNLVSLSNAGSFPYTEYTYVVTATGSVTDLDFTIQQNPSYFLLDNISVTPAGVPDASMTVVLLGLGLASLAVGRRFRASPIA